MSYMNFSGSLNVQNLTNKELIDLIKNNEYYSGCYRIIQEEKLTGLDILNISENRLAALNIPQWLSRKILSLKDTLNKNPESLKQSEIGNENDGMRKISIDNSTRRYKAEPVLHLKNISPIKKEVGSELIYDEDNYLNPNSMKGPKVLKFDKLPLKLPELLKLPNQRSHGGPPVPNRKPVALPRPDLSDEENQYEPPPRHTSDHKTALSKLPLPAIPNEDKDEYEAPPKYETEKPQSIEQFDYEYIETKMEENVETRGKSQTKFYVDDDFPPPLPERLILNKKEKQKSLFPPVYMNTDTAGHPLDSEGASSFPRSSGRKISPQFNRAISPILDENKPQKRRTWSVLTRPLPPLPGNTESRPLTPKILNSMEIEIDDVAYENTHKKTLRTETQPGNKKMNEHNVSFLNPSKSFIQNKDRAGDIRSLGNFQSRIFQMRAKQVFLDDGSRELQEKLKERLEIRETNRTADIISKKEDAVSITQPRLPLPPMLLPQNVQNTYFDDSINRSSNALSDSRLNSDDEEEESENLPEYLNTEETKPKSSTGKTAMSLVEISKTKLKPTEPERKHDSEMRDFKEDQDFQPEYLNTTEAQNSLRIEDSNIQQRIQPTISDLAAQISKVKLKSTPIKDINLNDKLADELRFLLKKRKGKNFADEGQAIDSSTRYNHQHMPVQNMRNFNFNSTEIENNDEDDIEQEDYDVAGSYNDLLNFNNEPFYRNTDRKGAIVLLNDLEDGAFLLRPSRKYFLSVTIKNKGKYFNLGIEKTRNNKITCGDAMMKSLEFSSLKEFLEYFEYCPLILQGERGLEEVYLKKVLPPDRF